MGLAENTSASALPCADHDATACSILLTRVHPPASQWWLAGSNHPYAPFVGNALKWQSYAYDDGTT